MQKWSYDKETATQFCVDFKGGVERYALSFLNLYNNAREYPNTFYHIENQSGTNKVFVVVNKNSAESVKEWLTDFGEIVWEEDVEVRTLHADYDSKGYDELFGGDLEKMWLVDIE